MRSQSIRQQAMSVSGASREQERAMSKDQMRGKSPDGMTQNSEGLKRRDLLLNGSSLFAAAALTGLRFATPSASTATTGDYTGTPPSPARLRSGDTLRRGHTRGI